MKEVKDISSSMKHGDYAVGICDHYCNKKAKKCNFYDWFTYLDHKFIKRMLLFKESLEKLSNQYNKDTIENFFNYWSEPNKSNTKMKFEQQTTWDLSRRLKRWSSYDFGNTSNGVKPKINFRMPDGKNYIGYCSKCNNSDFYDPFNFKPELIESKCCNAKILNERSVDVKSV